MLMAMLEGYPDFCDIKRNAGTSERLVLCRERGTGGYSSFGMMKPGLGRTVLEISKLTIAYLFGSGPFGPRAERGLHNYVSCHDSLEAKGAC